MKKTLIIVRHGNTFLPSETPTRVGGRTDLPLVEEDRARCVGRYLTDNNLRPDKIYAAPLKRTTQTAELIIDQMQLLLQVFPENDFIEIDYGPDENKTEDEVELRLGLLSLEKEGVPTNNMCREEMQKIGRELIDKWNDEAIVPDGWIIDTEEIIQSWEKFANNIEDGQTVVLCTSNGIIRFAPHILDMDYSTFCKEYDLKVATGSVSVFEYTNGQWICKDWNVNPYNLYKNK